MFYKYLVNISYSGYVRTNISSGELCFSEEFEITTDDKDKLDSLIYIKETGITKENFQNSNFNFDFENDEIVRNDMSKKVTIELLEIDDDVKFNSVESILNDKFPLITVDLKIFFDKIKHQINEKNYRNSNMIFNEYWNYLDENYFINNKVRLSIKELNLNGIRPQTYFDKFEINKKNQSYQTILKTHITYPILLTYYDYELFLPDLIDFLNKVIKGSFNFINLNQRIIDTSIPSNRKLKQQEKNLKLNKEKKIEDILKKKRSEYLEDISKTMESYGIDFNLKDLVLVLNLKK